MVTLATLIILLVVLLNVNQHRYLDDPADVDLSTIEFVNHSNAMDSVSNEDGIDKKSYLFYFEPNKIDIEKWQALGFSEKQSRVILNYRKKNGPFTKAEDLKPIYVISDDKYNELKPYMLFIDEAEDGKDTVEI